MEMGRRFSSSTSSQWRCGCATTMMIVLMLACWTSSSSMVHAADKEELPVSSSGAERHEEKKPERPLAASSSIQQQQQEAASSSAVRSSAPYEAAIEGLSSLEITSGMEGEKKKKAKPPKKPVVAHPLSPEVAHLLDLLSLKSTVKQDGAVLSLVQEFIAGVDIGLAVPIANAVAISLAEELAKVAKKDRLGMLAVIQSLVEQPDPEIKSRRYQALFAPADEALVVLEVPEDAGTVDEWTEGEASASEKAEVKQKTKLKEKKGEQKKKGAATLGKAEDRSPKGKGKAHHRESSTSGKEHSEEKKKLTITELIPNGNEHLGQLRTETKWLEKRGKSKSKSKKKQASVAAKGMSSEEEVASSLPWAEGDQRTNQALTIITKWTPKLVARIRVLAEMDAHRLPIDTQNARIIASGWIDALSRIKAKKLRLEVITELVPLRTFPVLIDSFLRLLSPKQGNETDRDYQPKVVSDVRLMVVVSRLPVFSRPCPAAAASAGKDEDLARFPASCYQFSDGPGHSACSLCRSLFIYSTGSMLLRSSQTAPSPSPSHAVQQHMAELLDLLRHFRPEEEEFVGRYFHSRALETSKAHRLRVASGGDVSQNIVPFDELKAEIVALLAIRSTWNQYTLQTYCIAFELVPPATRKELIDEIQMAQPRLELLDRILSWYFETQNSAKIDTRRLIACLLVWMKRLVEVNEELPRIFPRSYNEGTEATIPHNENEVVIGNVRYLDSRLNLVEAVWPIREVDIRRRVYAAIRGTRLSRLEIVYVLARPDTSLSYKASDFVDGTLQGKPVNQAALADQLVNAIKLAAALQGQKHPPTLSHPLYTMITFFKDPEMRF